MQETFLRIWNRVQSFDQERGALGPWVLDGGAQPGDRLSALHRRAHVGGIDWNSINWSIRR